LGRGRGLSLWGFWVFGWGVVVGGGGGGGVGGGGVLASRKGLLLVIFGCQGIF